MKKLGYTMIELLIVIGILAILISVLSQVFGSIMTMKLSSESHSSLAENSRYLLARLTYDLSSADSITTPVVGSSGTTLVLVRNGETITYSLTSNVLSRGSNLIASDRLTSSDTLVTSLNFVRGASIGSSQSISVAATLSSTVIVPGKTSDTQSFNSTILTRSGL